MDDWTVDLMLGDCLEMLKELDDNSVDAVVCDPPYGLSKEPDMAEVLRHWLAGDDYEHRGKGFMGKSWDSFVPGPSVWRECYRVLKPGGHLLSFFGTRTYDMGVLAIRLAGFEIRDQVGWCYGSGFPKSLNVSKAIDKALGAERVPTGRVKPGHEGFANRGNMSSVQSLKGTLGGEGGFARPWMDDPEKVEAYHMETRAGSPEAEKWEGWGTALKPAWEPICVARKPLKGTVAANVQKWGVGALNIDGCRVETDDNLNGGAYAKNATEREQMWGEDAGNSWKRGGGGEYQQPTGRWPANLIHDGSDEVLTLFPESKGQQGDVRGTEASRTGGEGTNCYGEYGRVPAAKRGDGGSAARFFYCAKANKRDRDEGLEAFEKKRTGGMQATADGSMLTGSGNERTTTRANVHPTVKPTDLMRFLCRLVTPPGGIVLDPFMGSGSTGKAAMLEGFRFIGIERDEAYFDIAEARIMAAKEAAKCKE